jgi:predicted permease
MMATLAPAILRMLALAGVGVALRVAGFVKREDARVVNAVIIYVGLPALIFKSVYTAELGWDVLAVAGVAWACTLAGLGMGWLLAKALKLEGPSAGALILVAGLGNTGYVGYPVTVALFGQAMLARAVFFDVFGTVGVAFTVGIAFAGRLGKHEGAVNVAKEFLTWPATVALLLALLLRLVPIPAAVQVPVIDWLGLAANMAVPLIMISLGLSLRAGALKGRLAALGGVAVVKLLAMPALAAGIGLVAGMRADLPLLVLQAGTPSMMLSLILCDRFDLDTDLAAAAILITTVACIVTIPLGQVLLPA